MISNELKGWKQAYQHNYVGLLNSKIIYNFPIDRCNLGDSNHSPYTCLVFAFYYIIL